MAHPRRSLDRLPLRLAVLLTVLTTALAQPGSARPRRDERGDVPGWVMVTVMTAGLVAVLTSIAGPQLREMLTSALSSVK